MLAEPIGSCVILRFAFLFNYLIYLGDTFPLEETRGIIFIGESKSSCAN